MALAYATTGSPLQGNTTLRDDILAGLDWMYANRYNEKKSIYDNWWHWEIGSPMALVDIATLAALRGTAPALVAATPTRP